MPPIFLSIRYQTNGLAIEPCSIALVSEDLEPLYIEMIHDPARGDQFAREEIHPHLWWDPLDRLSRQSATWEVLNFLQEIPGREIWAWNGPFETVALHQLFAGSPGVPKEIPPVIWSIRQLCHDVGWEPEQIPVRGARTALALATWSQDIYQAVRSYYGIR